MDQDRRQSKQFDQATITSALEVSQADVTTSRPTTPPIMKDREGNNDASRDVTAPVGIEAIFLMAIRDKDHDGGEALFLDLAKSKQTVHWAGVGNTALLTTTQ